MKGEKYRFENPDRVRDFAIELQGRLMRAGDRYPRERRIEENDQLKGMGEPVVSADDIHHAVKAMLSVMYGLKATGTTTAGKDRKA